MKSTFFVDLHTRYLTMCEEVTKVICLQPHD